MNKHYYAHLIYDNPGVYDFEFIIDRDDINRFLGEVLDSMQHNYDQIYGAEELNLIDIGGWDDFIEENKIEYNEGDYFPYELIWALIKAKVENTIKNIENTDIKFNVLEEAIQIYLQIIEDANLAYGDYVFKINIFKDSSSFAKHFFQYLEDTAFSKKVIMSLKDRIEFINRLISEDKFPISDYDEGILGEWLEIYHIIYEYNY